ncbi:1,4-dihydroxy-2-naphthoate octaprenyltransferase [Burkholderiales bacterium]|nr:1,4-dihydroxy-2-naphthoate octaprenyltransferase [Burkholderiales bacterium]
MTRRELWIKLLLYPGHTLPTAAAPVLVAIGLAIHDGVFAPLPAALAFVGSWLVHVAGVFTDNHELVRRHPELPEHPELLDAVADRSLALSTLGVATRLCLVLAALCGAWLVWIGGAVALAIGAIGVASALAYAGGPWPYAPRGLADPIFFLMFGVVAVAATWYVQAVSLAPSPGPWLTRWTDVPLSAYVVGLPAGALVTAVLVIDDIRDRGWDARKGWRTGAVRWGLAWSRGEFVALMLFAYLAPFALWLGLGFTAWVLLPLATAPLAVQASRAVLSLDDTRSLLRWTPRTARLGLIHSALLAVGLAVRAHAA